MILWEAAVVLSHTIGLKKLEHSSLSSCQSCISSLSIGALLLSHAPYTFCLQDACLVKTEPQSDANIITMSTFEV